MLLKHEQTRTEVLQGQGTCATDVHISRAKCLPLLLAASGSLQTIYLHLRNNYLVEQTHEQFTLTQKSGLVSSEETMKKIIFFLLFCQMSVKAFLKGVYLIFSRITLYIYSCYSRNKTKQNLVHKCKQIWFWPDLPKPKASFPLLLAQEERPKAR